MFGFEANCDFYVIESTIFFNDADQSGAACFMPPGGAFKITAQGVHNPGLQKLPVIDAAGQTIHTFDLVKAGEDVTFDVPDGLGDRSGLWRADIERMDVKLAVQGVTVWNLDRAAYFDADVLRRMLMPLVATRFIEPEIGRAHV